MKTALVVGLVALAGFSAFAQVSENKAPLQKKTVRVRGKAQSGAASAASKVSLNPQPLPPSGDPTSAASKVSLNPQPLPPKTKTSVADSPTSKVALNPQPLPPKPSGDPTSAAS